MDPEQLTLLALGEAPGDAEDAAVTAHLRECPTCRDELGALRDTVALTREAVEFRDAAPAPPPMVWDRIAADVGLRDDQPSTGGVVVDLPQPRTAVRPTRGRRGRTAAALVAAVAIGVAGTLIAVRPWEDAAPPMVVASSSARLGPVDGGPDGATGEAAVVPGATGPQLRVTATGLPTPDGYYEVWVFDGRERMVAVGVLGPDSTAVLPLPATLDLATYPVVDVSAEQYDGDQTHSTTSVLRGTLTR